MEKPDPADPMAWRDELTFLLSYSHTLSGEPLRLWVSREGRLCASPRSAVEREPRVRAALALCKEQLLAYLTPVPRAEWPASFLDEESGEPLACVRGHPYDLCRRDGDGRYLCRCYYDWDFAEKRRIPYEPQNAGEPPALPRILAAQPSTKERIVYNENLQ